jgi:hypothetical protein
VWSFYTILMKVCGLFNGVGPVAVPISIASRSKDVANRTFSDCEIDPLSPKGTDN